MPVKFFVRDDDESVEAFEAQINTWLLRLSPGLRIVGVSIASTPYEGFDRTKFLIYACVHYE